MDCIVHGVTKSCTWPSNFHFHWCFSPWVYPAWDSLCFLDLADSFLFHVRVVSSYHFFKYFLKPFLSPYSLSGTPKMQMLVCLMFSQRFLRLSSFFFFSILFSRFCSAAVIHSVLQVPYLFFCICYSGQSVQPLSRVQLFVTHGL